MKDIVEQLEAIRREVASCDTDKGPGVAVRIRRTYRADVEDVWDAITSPERLPRWFAPVAGDLREGGSFQIEGNASGDILRCAAPRLLRMTYGGPSSIVEVRLTAVDAGTDLEVEHTVPLSIAGGGAGALFVGPGWDQGFVLLARHLGGEVIADPAAEENSIEGQQLSLGSIEAWERAARDSGLATEDEIAGGVAAARAHFTPDL